MKTWAIPEWAGDTGIRDNVRELQRQSMQTVDRIERKYAGRMRIEQQRVRREVERETVEEIRAAIERMTL